MSRGTGQSRKKKARREAGPVERLNAQPTHNAHPKFPDALSLVNRVLPKEVSTAEQKQASVAE